MRCQAPNCIRSAGTKGLCDMHYRRMRRHGHFGRKLLPPAERFWTLLDKNGGNNACWPWTQCRGSGGYGLAWDGHKRIRAHRLAWILTHGSIPVGADVLHTCDNPPCCNPKHLWLGRDLENRRDCIGKGRARYAVGEDFNRKLTDSQVKQIRAIWQQDNRPSQQAIGDMFGVNQRMVSSIVLRKTWKHI